MALDFFEIPIKPPGSGVISISLLLTLNKRLPYRGHMDKSHKPDPAAVSLGRRGGQATAKRGAEYFRQINSMRKVKGGGRPPKSAKLGKN